MKETRYKHNEIRNIPNNGEVSEFFYLKLFITGMTPNSMQAVRNIKDICERYLNDTHYKLEIIDIYQNSNLVKGENIVVTPTLIRKLPAPELRVVGDLSVTGKVLNLFSITKQ